MDLERFFKALSSETRIRIIEQLLKRPGSVSHLVSKTDRSQPDISIALNKLHLLGLVDRERDGRHVIYTLRDKQTMKRIFQEVKRYA